MSARFEELAWCDTPDGDISPRRRREPTLGVDVYAVRLGEEFLWHRAGLVPDAEELLTSEPVVSAPGVHATWRWEALAVALGPFALALGDQWFANFATPAMILAIIPAIVLVAGILTRPPHRRTT